MKLTQYIKREIEATSLSGKERAFVITLVIMLCIVVSFIIIRVNNKPEEIWLEIPPAEEIDKLLKEEKIPEDIQKEPPKVEPYKVNDGMSFKDLEKYKPQNKNEKKANKRTLISYYLSGREAVAELPNPVYTCEESGKVVVNITVDDQGRVIEASYNKASSSTANGCLIDNAIYYARKARFNKDSKNKQLGTITYLFQ